MKKNVRLIRAALLSVLFIGLWVAIPTAHDIPADVTVQMLVKPDGNALRVAVRVPLQAMRDMDYPKPRNATNADLLDLARADATLRDAATLWISDYLDVYENGAPLGRPRVVSVRAALQSDKSFASYDEALAHLGAPGLAVETEFFWSQGLLDVLFEYPIGSERSRFSISPRLARLGIRTLTVLRFLPPGDGVRTFEFIGDPGLVPLDPVWSETTLRFVNLGVARFIGSADQLLFVIVLVAPFRRLRSIVVLITGCAIAESIALVASAMGLALDALWFPPLVDSLIAASIVYLALENILIANQKKPGSPQRPQSNVLATTPENKPPDDFPAISTSSAVVSWSVKRRWIAVFAFGVAHGFGLSFALRPMLQLAGSHALTGIVSFTLGVDVGQVLVAALAVSAFALIFRFLVAEQIGVIVVSALAGHSAWHWLGERGDLLRKFTFEPPAVDAAFLAAVLRWMMLLVVAAGLYWLIFGVFDPRREGRRAENLKPGL